MNIQEYIDKYNKGELLLLDAYPLIECLLLEREESTGVNEAFEQLKLPTFGGLNYKDVFEQEEFYNGHGQLEVPRMTLTEASGLIRELEDHADESESPMDNIFTLKLYVADDGKYSGSIYQETTRPKMWLSIGEVLVDE